MPNDIDTEAQKALEKAKAFTGSAEMREQTLPQRPPKKVAPGTPPRSQYARVRAARM